MISFFQKLLLKKLGWLAVVAILVVVHFISSTWHSRIDLTKEKRYTISPYTRSVLKTLEGPLKIQVFLKGNYPAGFQKLANTANDFLAVLKENNSSKIQYSFLSPYQEVLGGTGKLYKDTLEALGISPINLTVQAEDGQQQNLIYPAALITYNNKQQLVTLYPGSNRVISQTEINEAEALLEYQFINKIDKLISNQKPVVAYALGNGEPDDYRTYDLQSTIQSNYNFFTFNLKDRPVIPNEIQVLVVAKPSISFSEAEKLKLDQFVMRGGKLLCFIDNLYAEPDSLANGKSQTIAYNRNLNLTDLFFKWGARINADLVMDLQCEALPFIVGGSASQPQQEYLRWNYYPIFQPSNNHAINRNLGLVGARFVGSIDTIITPDIKKTILLSSSSSSRSISTPAIISLNENSHTPQDEKFTKNNIPVAMLLEGEFSSLYANRIQSAQRDSLAFYNTPFKARSIANKIILVADGDIILNEALPQSGPLPMGWNKYTYYEYESKTPDAKYFVPVANRQFFENSLEYLIANDAILETRNKNMILRMLDTKKVKAQKVQWQLINIAIPILIIIIFGLIYYKLRKIKYGA